MSVSATLRREGIEDIKPLSTLEINKIASSIAEKICSAFPEHNIDRSDLFIAIARLNMYTAKMPQDHSAAKYFYKNNSIYFSNDINFDNISTLAIHEAIHFIQEVRSKSGKRLLRMGLHDFSKGNSGTAINEAAVQLMASIANSSKIDSVKYYDLEIETESPDYYPLECALIKQMQYFTGSYALFHSTLYADDIFKNTFIVKSDSKIYQKIEYNFDLLFHYEELLNIEMNNLKEIENIESNLKKIKYKYLKIQNIKYAISKIALETQELITVNCFFSELNLVKNTESLNNLKIRLDDFRNILIHTENYTFYDDFYIYMMNKLYEKEKLIAEFGSLDYAQTYETSLISPTQTSFAQLFINMYQKLKLLFENYNFFKKEI